MTSPTTIRLVVMGVAGSGKTSLAGPVADALGARLVEADDLHPPANVAKMSSGAPLTDDDRWPWLERVADELADAPVVATCSALKRVYRDVLRRAGGVRFVHLVVDEATAHARLSDRPGHFMGPAMVASQFEALEPPGDDEDDVIRLDATADVASNVAEVLAALGRRRPVEADDGVSFEVVDPESHLAVEALTAYFAELDERFVGGFETGDTIVADAPSMREPAGVFVVAVADGRPVGCGAVVSLDATTGEIKRMWVAPSARGRGLGRRLLAELERQVVSLGHRRVVLDTNEVLSEARAMYASAGYTPIERYNDNPYAMHWFTRDLA